MRPDTTGDSLPVCSDGQRLTLLEPTILHLWWGDACVTRGLSNDFSWDGATIPRWLWWLFGHPLAPEFRLASLWHDIGCNDAQCIEDRIIADAVFLRLLKDAGVKKWRRVAMWAGVRFYATFVWSFKRWLRKR
jgi:hypothetical protein